MLNNWDGKAYEIPKKFDDPPWMIFFYDGRQSNHGPMFVKG